MDKTEDISVLRRKIGGPPQTPQDGDQPAVRALRLAIARVSRETLGMCLDVIGGAQGVKMIPDLGGVLSEDALLMQLGAADGVSGVAALGPQLVGALIQQQTYGALISLGDHDRDYTDTDAALCAPLLETVLSRAIDLTPRDEDKATLGGHRFVRRVPDVASMIVTLEGDRFRVFELNLDVAVGTAQATLTLVLRDRPAMPKVPVSKAKDRGPVTTLDQVAMNASVRLNAVLCRVPMMLSDMAGLKAGQLLPLPAYRIDQTELLTMSGRRVANGRLGRVEGLRAVRVNETTVPESEFTEPTPPPAPDLPQALMESAPPPMPDLPTGEDDFALDQLDQDEAMKRISELAGLEDGGPDLGGPPLAPPALDGAGLDPVGLDPGTLDPGALDPGTLDIGALDIGTADIGGLDTGDLETGA